MRLVSYLYIVFAFFYLLGREGFVSSPDVFNKTRPNRHINIAELPQSVLSLQSYVINADRQKPQRLPSKLQKQNISFIKSQNETFYLFAIKTPMPYKGIRVMPPPLLG